MAGIRTSGTQANLTGPIPSLDTDLREDPRILGCPCDVSILVVRRHLDCDLPFQHPLNQFIELSRTLRLFESLRELPYDRLHAR